MNANRVLFTEKQRVSPASWIFSLVNDHAAPVGLAPMTTTVTPRYLNVHRGPRRYETWRIEDVASFEVEVAGASGFWRRGPAVSDANAPVYSLGATGRVAVTLSDGRRLVLGTRRPQELCAALHQARAEARAYRGTQDV